jgi:hypothetical protein
VNQLQWAALIGAAVVLSLVLAYGLTYAITRSVNAGQDQFEQSWGRFGREIGGELLPSIYSRAPHSSIVRAPLGDWTLILDAYRIADEDYVRRQQSDQPVWWTRMRVPFLRQRSFDFVVYREVGFSKLGRQLLGDQALPDIEVGDLGFDRTFFVSGSEPAGVRALLGNPRIRQLLQSHPHVRLGITTRRDDPLDRGQSVELYCQRAGVMTDLEPLCSLYELVRETFQQLQAMGIVSTRPPRLPPDSYRS